MVKMENNMNIKMIFDIINKKKWIIVVILALFIMLGYLYTTYGIVPQYKASQTMILVFNNNDTNNANLVLNSNLMSTYTSLVKESKVLKEVIQNLGLNITEQELANKIEVENMQDTYVIRVNVIDENPQMTVQIANEIANVFMKEVKELYNLKNIEILNEAEVPENPFNKNYLKNIGVSLGIGVILCAVYIFIVFNFDNTIKKQEDIENYLKIKVLAEIPANGNNQKKPKNDLDTTPYITECMNTIRTNILYMSSLHKEKTVLITSCNPSEGKSWVSANLAASFAKLHKKVLLIDADMRKGRIHQIFGLKKGEGLSDYLYAIKDSLRDNILLGKKYIKETSISNLHILPNGIIPSNPSELLNSTKMKQLLGILRNIYDIIIIDAPPCKLVTDSMILATMVDSIVLVVKAEQTKMKELQEVQKSLETVGGKIIGAILNQKEVKETTYQESYLYEKVEKEKKNEEVLYLPETTKEDAITVETILEEAVNTIKSEDLKENAQVKSTKRFIVSKRTKVENGFREMIEKQNRQLDQIKETISKLEVQTNSNILDNKAERNKLEQFVTSQIEKMKSDYATQLETMRSDYDIQIKTMKSDYDIQLETVKKDMYTEEDVQSIVSNQISSKNQESKKEMTTFLDRKIKDLQKEFSKNNGAKQLNKIEHRIDKIGQDYLEQVKQLSDRMTTISEEQTKQSQQLDDKILEVGQSYAEQIKQLSDKITEISENQLEQLERLENEISNSNQDDEEKIENPKIIDIKLFNKKKKVYSIDEDISYYDLEKNAIKVIPIRSQEANQVELRA